MAVENGHFELAVALVEAGADPNDRRTGFTPLHTMTWVRKPDASDTGDPSPIGSGRLTSLQFVRVLVKSGADVNARLPKGAPRPPNTASRVGTGGATPFLMAADRADAALMRVLIELGADPFLPNLDNTTPLMAAAGLGTTAPLEEAGTEPEALEAMRLLLDLGADIDAVNSDGDSAMHGAAFGNFPTIVRLLADRGASADIWKRPDGQGRTPLFIAEGYRGGPLRPSRPTIDEITRLMVAKGLSMDGPRPLGVVRDTYEKPAPVPPKRTLGRHRGLPASFHRFPPHAAVGVALMVKYRRRQHIGLTMGVGQQLVLAALMDRQTLRPAPGADGPRAHSRHRSDLRHEIRRMVPPPQPKFSHAIARPTCGGTAGRGIVLPYAACIQRSEEGARKSVRFGMRQRRPNSFAARRDRATYAPMNHAPGSAPSTPSWSLGSSLARHFARTHRDVRVGDFPRGRDRARRTMERMAEANTGWRPNGRMVQASSWPFVEFSTHNVDERGSPDVRLRPDQ